jgi:hypothetical protein
MLGIGVGLFVILTMILIILTYSVKMSAIDKNKEALQTVIKQIFTCPNEKMISLYKDMNKEVEDIIANLPADTTVYTIDNKVYREIDSELEHLYAPYISSEWYESFIFRFKTNYYIYSVAEGYECKANRIEITQSSTIPTNYSFAIYLSYGLKEKKKEIELKGSAQFAKEEGKLSYIQFFIDRDFQTDFMSTYKE